MKFYDFSKGGTDIIDQMMGNYTVSSVSPRWIMSSFAYMLDTMRVNAQTIHSLNGGIDPRKRKSFRFGWDLILSLVVPFIKNRKAQAKGLPKKTLSKMDVILNEYEAEEEPEVHNVMEGPITLNHPPISPQRKRCKFCIRSLRGSTDSHTNLSKLSQLKTQC